MDEKGASKMTEIHDVAKGVVKAGVKGTADATFKLGTLEAGSKERETELRQHLRSAMLAWLGSTVLVMLPIGLLTRNPLYGLGAGLVLMGVYSLITGRAVLKPGLTQHSVFLGWKARVVGVLLLLFALLSLSLGANPRP